MSKMVPPLVGSFKFDVFGLARVCASHHYGSLDDVKGDCHIGIKESNEAELCVRKAVCILFNYFSGPLVVESDSCNSISLLSPNILYLRKLHFIWLKNLGFMYFIDVLVASYTHTHTHTYRTMNQRGRLVGPT